MGPDYRKMRALLDRFSIPNFEQMQTNDAETNLLIFKAFLLGKHVALRTFNVSPNAVEEESEKILQQVADGELTLIPEAPTMLRVLPDADRSAWKKRFEATRPDRIAEEQSLAKAALLGMKEFLRIK